MKSLKEQLREGAVKARNKAKKNNSVKRTNFPDGASSDYSGDAPNPHGTDGGQRGVKKKKGSKPSKLQQQFDQRSNQAGVRMRARLKESHLNIGRVMADALGLSETAGERGAQAASGAMRPRGESRVSSHNEKVKRLQNWEKKKRDKKKSK